MNEAFNIGIPLVAIVAGILFNKSDFNRLESRLKSDFNRLESRMDRMESDLKGRIDRIDSDLKEFYRTLGQHDARLANIEKKA